MASAGEHCEQLQAFVKAELTNEDRWKTNKVLARAVGLFVASAVFSRFFGELMAI